ncbi:MAG TPA: hypothetical protein VI564_07060, partial [Candidatus Nanoarchaeia archaeon]|nr:hypothetical protein [Candidatus Nanoarchaeia archaeon]
MIAAAFLRDFVKGVAFDKLAKSVSSFYDRLRNKDEIYQRIKDYRIKNDKLGIDDTVANLAKQYNVPLDQYVSRLSDYLKRDTNYLNAVLAKLKSRLSGEDLGKSEAEIYAQASKADDLVSRLMGYAKAPDTKQRINYLNDKVRGYIGSAYQK